MEIQVSFPGLNANLSYECIDQVVIGDKVQIAEGMREDQIGTTIALERGSYIGMLMKCRKFSNKEWNLYLERKREIAWEARLHDQHIFDM